MQRFLLVCAMCLFVAASNYGGTANGMVQQAFHSRAMVPQLAPVSTHHALLLQGLDNPRGVVTNEPTVTSNFQLVFVLADGYQGDGASGIYLFEPRTAGPRQAPKLVVSLADLGGARPTSAAIDPSNCGYSSVGLVCMLFVTTEKGDLYREQLVLK
jgi:hypothetical protein